MSRYVKIVSLSEVDDRLEKLEKRSDRMLGYVVFLSLVLVAAYIAGAVTENSFCSFFC